MFSISLNDMKQEYFASNSAHKVFKTQTCVTHAIGLPLIGE